MDDNADMRDYVARLLADRYDLTAVGDGRMAMEAIDAGVWDVVVTDITMPGLDGLELVHRIRTDPQHKGTPVILLAALAHPEAAVGGLVAGANDYIVKPFTALELIARVDAQLSLARIRSGAPAPDGDADR
ncbi:MAG: response regulator [Actinomycetota bacterium]|nr:response regulator [Actinomycetota bacterium]